MEIEGFDSRHDAGHMAGELALAGAVYAAHHANASMLEQRAHPHFEALLRHSEMFVRHSWPWGSSWWKPKGNRHDLVKAAALILAEIDRLDRAAAGLGG